MNTLCLYVFWNLHEETPGNYDFTGNKDIAAFCKIGSEAWYVRHCASRSRMYVRNGKWVGCLGGC